jgi:predicted esterase
MIYDYERKNFEVKETLILENKSFKKYRFEFESFIKTPYPETNKVIGYFFNPSKKASNKILLFLHGMGDRNLSPLTWFPQKFAEEGIPSYLLILPYHFERTPPGMKSGKKFLIDDMNDTIKDFQQAIIDLRTSMDYLERRYNFADFSIMGFSFGGMIGTITMAVDGRIKSGIFVVTGGNYLYITWKSLATRMLRKKYEVQSNYNVYGCTEQKCIEVHKNYPEYTSNLKTVMDLDKISYIRGCYLFDPLTFAHFIKRRKVILYNAIFDEIIPRDAANALWTEMGKPERHWLFADHLTSVFYRRLIFHRALKLVLEDK